MMMRAYGFDIIRNRKSQALFWGGLGGPYNPLNKAGYFLGGVHHEWTSLKNSRNQCRKKTLHPLSGRTHFTCMVIYSSRTCQITLYTWIHIKRIMVMISTHHHQLILFTNQQSSFRWTLQHLDIRPTKIGALRPYPEPHGSAGRQSVDKNNDPSSPNELFIKEKTSGNADLFGNSLLAPLLGPGALESVVMNDMLMTCKIDNIHIYIYR